MAPRLPTLGETTWAVVRARPGVLGALTLGVVAYSVGHAGLACAAGSLAAALGEAPGVALLWGDPAPGASLTPLYVGLVAALVKATSGTVVAHSERVLAADAARHLRMSVLARLLRGGASTPSPQTLATLGVRLREVEAAVLQGHFASARGLSQLVPLVVALVVWSPTLASLSLLGGAPFAFAAAALRKRARRAAEHAQRQAEDLECGVDDLVRNADLWRSYGAGARVTAAVEGASRAAGRSAARVDAARAALSGANEVAAVIAVFAALAVGTRLGVPSSHTFLPFAALFFMGYRPVRDLGDARSWIARGAVALDAVQKLAVTAPGDSEDRSVGPSVAVPAGGLSLEGFGGSARGPATTLHVADGELVCLVGPTGAGKTTLLRALLGLEPARGRALFAGSDVTHAPAGPQHRPFAWVPQEAPLVTGTVTENVTLVAASEPSAQAALRAVGARGLLGIGPDEVVGPGGRPLSGGERRQIAIARAVASGLPVLLLDEPTEGLDEQARDAVLELLSALRGSRTLLVATHRDEVAEIADRVVTLGTNALDVAAE